MLTTIKQIEKPPAMNRIGELMKQIENEKKNKIKRDDTLGETEEFNLLQSEIFHTRPRHIVPDENTSDFNSNSKEIATKTYSNSNL